MKVRATTTIAALAAVFALAPATAQQAADPAGQGANPAAQGTSPGAQGASPGGAQGGAPGAGMAGAQRFDDQTLEQFVEASTRVSEIRQEYSTKISEAGDQTEAQTLQQEAHGKMVDAITEQDLDVTTYNAIAERIASDPELEQRVQGMM